MPCLQNDAKQLWKNGSSSRRVSGVWDWQFPLHGYQFVSSGYETLRSEGSASSHARNARNYDSQDLERLQNISLS